MTVELDPVIRVGTVTVAALARRVVGRGPGRAAAFLGSKCPVAVLVREGDATFAFDASGTRIELEAFERLFPGRRAEFELAAKGAREGQRG